MSLSPANPYPGTSAHPDQVRLLADQYRKAALELLRPRQDSPAALRAPAIFCAIHAIELYLNAQIRDAGGTPQMIRGFQHRLGEMSKHEAVAALNLRRKTKDHLGTMTAKREYLVVRYEPESTDQLSELTRLKATLEEVATKVGASMDRTKKQKRRGDTPPLPKTLYGCRAKTRGGPTSPRELPSGS